MRSPFPRLSGRVALPLLCPAERGEQFAVQQSEVTLDPVFPADQHVIGIGHAMERQHIAQQRAESALHAVAHDRIADPLGDGDAETQTRAIVGAGEQDEARSGHAQAAVGGDESRIVRCLKLGGFVNCEPDFDQMPAVINGASDLIGEVLGERGNHARFAVGAPNLPFGVAVEIDAIFEIKV